MRKDLKFFLWVAGSFLAVLMLLGVISTLTYKPTEKKAPAQSKVETKTPQLSERAQILKKTVQEGKEDLEWFVKRGIERGVIMKIEPQYSKVYVDSLRWGMLTFDQKKNTAFFWLQYCAMKQNEYEIIWVDILDGHSGKKLAKYDSWGFKPTER